MALMNEYTPTLPCHETQGIPEKSGVKRKWKNNPMRGKKPTPIWGILMVLDMFAIAYLKEHLILSVDVPEPNLRSAVK